MCLKKIGLHLDGNIVDEYVVGIDGDCDDFRAAARLIAKGPRSFDRDVARAWRIEVEADISRSCGNRRFDGLARRETADFDVSRHRQPRC